MVIALLYGIGGAVLLSMGFWLLDKIADLLFKNRTIHLLTAIETGISSFLSPVSTVELQTKWLALWFGKIKWVILWVVILTILIIQLLRLKHVESQIKKGISPVIKIEKVGLAKMFYREVPFYNILLREDSTAVREDSATIVFLKGDSISVGLSDTLRVDLSRKDSASYLFSKVRIQVLEIRQDSVRFAITDHIGDSSSSLDSTLVQSERLIWRHRDHVIVLLVNRIDSIGNEVIISPQIRSKGYKLDKLMPKDD